MAINYFAITSTDPDGTHNLDIPQSMYDNGRDIMGIVRVWENSTPPTPSAKYVIVGNDLVAGDSSRLRSISTQLRNRMINALQQQMSVSKAQLADYGRSLGRGFRVDIAMSATDVGNL